MNERRSKIVTLQ